MNTELAQQNFSAHVSQLAQQMLSSVADEKCAKMAGQRLALALQTAAQSNPEIYACSPQSVAQCVANSALTELLPGGPLPQVYLIPRRIKGVQTLTWMVSHRGLVQMAERSGHKVRATAVDDRDGFKVTLGLTQSLEHEPKETPEWQTLKGVYVVATPIDGSAAPEFMWVAKGTIEKRRKASAAGGSGPWRDWPVEMALKTALRYAINRGLVPIEDPGLLRALQADGETDRPAVETTATVVAPSHRVSVTSGMAGLTAALAPPEAEPVPAPASERVTDPVTLYAVQHDLDHSQRASLRGKVASLERSGHSPADAFQMATS